MIRDIWEDIPRELIATDHFVQLALRIESCAIDGEVRVMAPLNLFRRLGDIANIVSNFTIEILPLIRVKCRLQVAEHRVISIELTRSSTTNVCL